MRRRPLCTGLRPALWCFWVHSCARTPRAWPGPVPRTTGQHREKFLGHGDLAEHDALVTVLEVFSSTYRSSELTRSHVSLPIFTLPAPWFPAVPTGKNGLADRSPEMSRSSSFGVGVRFSFSGFRWEKDARTRMDWKADIACHAPWPMKTTSATLPDRLDAQSLAVVLSLDEEPLGNHGRNFMTGHVAPFPVRPSGSVPLWSGKVASQEATQVHEKPPNGSLDLNALISCSVAISSPWGMCFEDGHLLHRPLPGH